MMESRMGVRERKENSVVFGEAKGSLKGQDSVSSMMYS